MYSLSDLSRSAELAARDCLRCYQTHGERAQQLVDMTAELEQLRADLLLAKSKESQAILELVSRQEIYRQADSVPTVSAMVDVAADVDRAEREALGSTCDAAEILFRKRQKEKELSALCYCVCGPCTGRMCPH